MQVIKNRTSLYAFPFVTLEEETNIKQLSEALEPYGGSVTKLSDGLVQVKVFGKSTTLALGYAMLTTDKGSYRIISVDSLNKQYTRVNLSDYTILEARVTELEQVMKEVLSSVTSEVNEPEDAAL